MNAGQRSARWPIWLSLVLGIVLAAQLVIVNYWPHFASPNERSRAYQALAVVTRGSLAIDEELARFGGMEDVAGAGGRLFPNKAPGLLPLLLPGALVARLAAAHNPELELLLALVLGRLLASSLPFCLTILLLARHLVPALPRGGPFAVAAFALATPSLAGSALLFSHALTALLLLLAYLLVLANDEQPTRARALAAGFCLAWAVVAEYSAAPAVAVLAVLALARSRSRLLLALAAGGAVPIAALAAYNAACFLSPFSLSSGHESHAAFAALAAHGVFGITRPTLAGLWGLLASPSRGLLVWAPHLALAALGMVAGRLPDEPPLARAAVLGAPLISLAVTAGYPNWHGGWAPGPRYLLSVVPLLTVLVARGAELALASVWGRLLAAVAALWGLAGSALSLASFPFPPEDFPLPAVTFALPLLRDSIHVPTWLPAPFLLPAFIVLVGAALAVLLHLATPREWRIGLGALACAGLLLVAAARLRPPATFKASLELAVVRDLYAGGGRRGALEALLPSCEPPEQRRIVERWIAEREASITRTREVWHAPRS